MDTEIPKAADLEEQVFGIHNEKEFQRIALSVYHFQFANNSLYRSFCELLDRTPANVTSLSGIPFLPVSFFKSHKVATTEFDPELVFRSSGTTGQATSAHYLRSARLYEHSFLKGFQSFFGEPRDYCILGLLPSYLERKDSSLVYMVNRLIRESGHPRSGFYLHDLNGLAAALDELEKAAQKTILFGVSFALLDLAIQFPRRLRHTLVVETGGMKGRRKEMTRAELHALLGGNLGLQNVYGEYGMTELLSQAYGSGGFFRCPPWMRVLLREETDPLAIEEGVLKKKTGVINIIDLANIYSCSFIATEDLGRQGPENSFEVLGRLDHSDIRGCSQMAL